MRRGRDGGGEAFLTHWTRALIADDDTSLRDRFWVSLAPVERAGRPRGRGDGVARHNPPRVPPWPRPSESVRARPGARGGIGCACTAGAKEGTTARSARGRGSASTGGSDTAARSAGARASASTGGSEAGARSAGARACASTGGGEASARSAGARACASTGGGEASARMSGGSSFCERRRQRSRCKECGGRACASTAGHEASAAGVRGLGHL